MNTKCKRLFSMLCLSTLLLNTIASEKPNIVFIISDQHKLKAAGCYGDPLAITPHLDQLAKRGVRLNNCYVNAPVCAMSRASYMTGMEPYVNGAIYHKAPVQKNGKEVRLGAGFLRETGYHKGITTLAQVFRNHGYLTAAPGKMHVHGELQKNIDPKFPEGNDLGFDEISLRYYTNFPGGHYSDVVGVDTYHRYRQLKGYKSSGGVDNLNTNYLATHVVEDEENYDMVVTQKAVDYLNKRGADKKPFFLHVGLEKPHPPFTTAQRYLDLFNPEDFELPETYDEWYTKGKFPWSPDWIHSGLPKNSPKKAKNAIASYYACVTQVDDMVGRIVESLKENGLSENTIVIYTTDHGEHLFEHGYRGKHNMNEASVNVPFIISYPKELPQNTTNNSLVSLVDLMPTFCEIFDWEIPSNATGQSFYGILQSGAMKKDRTVYCEYRSGNYKAFPKEKDLPSRMVRREDFKYIYTHGIIDQFYQVEKDPNELENLAFSPEYEKLVKKWRFQALADWRFPDYYPMKFEKVDGMLRWNSFEGGATSYTLHYSEDSNPLNAEIVKDSIGTNSVDIQKPGYYWVTANPDYTRTVKRFGERPVLLQKHSYQLPVTDAVWIQ